MFRRFLKSTRLTRLFFVWPLITLATSAPSSANPPGGVAVERKAPGVDKSQTKQPQDSLGTQLFARHCAACHGERGDGLGQVAEFLFPRPRNIRKGRFRLVSTKNSVPTRDDLLAVLERGMPGSSMPSWAHLSEQEKEALVDEIERLRSEGARENYITSLRELDGLTDEEIAEDDVQQEIEEHVTEFTTPGEGVDVPAIGKPTAEQISNGQRVYSQVGCVSCHGVTGKGDGVQAMLDEENLPTSPRDFTLGIFKGNPAPASLYRRIAYGMPGTPMPGSSTMTPEQMVDLVHYIRSLSTEEQRQAAVLRREQIRVRRLSQVPKTENDRQWSSIAPVSLRLFPLWWRNEGASHVAVQAVHDRKTLAIRLSWDDETADTQALKSEIFEDAAAVQLYRGQAEPFLGMGSADAPVDVWFWDADRQAGESAVEKVYPRAIVDVFPFSEASVNTAELNRPGARIADQPDISLPARAVGNLIVPAGPGNGGSTLRGGGPGTVTFQLPRNESVRAQGNWANNRWSVVLTRPLSSGAGEPGISLRAGERVSAAFAIWDGSHRDRNGQKLITIWQDLLLDK